MKENWIYKQYLNKIYLDVFIIQKLRVLCALGISAPNQLI